MCTTDRSKAVVPMLFLFRVALWVALRGASCLVLPCSLSMCFLCPFSILITLFGKRELVFVLIVNLFVSYAHVNLCHFFSLPPGVGVCCGFCLWLFLDFSDYLLTVTQPTFDCNTTDCNTIGHNTLFLSSPHLCFIIVFICDLFVSRDDPLMG